MNKGHTLEIRRLEAYFKDLGIDLKAFVNSFSVYPIVSDTEPPLPSKHGFWFNTDDDIIYININNELWLEYEGGINSIGDAADVDTTDIATGKMIEVEEVGGNFVHKYVDKPTGGGDENVIEEVQVDGEALPVTDKSVNVDLSGKVDKETTISIPTFSGDPSNYTVLTTDQHKLLRLQGNLNDEKQLTITNDLEIGKAVTCHLEWGGGKITLIPDGTVVLQMLDDYMVGDNVVFEEQFTTFQIIKIANDLILII